MGRSPTAAGVRLLVVLATMSTTPLPRRMAEGATAEPRLEEIVVANVPTTLARPGRARPCSTLVFVNGVTAQGRRHPDVRRLARALARAGYLVLVPDLTGLARGEISERTLAAAVAVGGAAAEWLFRSSFCEPPSACARAEPLRFLSTMQASQSRTARSIWGCRICVRNCGCRGFSRSGDTGFG